MYDVWWDYVALSADRAHVMLGSECDRGGADRVATLLLDVLHELADGGPSLENLAAAKRMAERAYMDNPDRARADLDRAALEELLGGDPTPLDQDLDALRALEPEDVAAVFRSACDDLIVLTPTDVPKPHESLVPLERPLRDIPGRRFKAKGVRQSDELIVGDHGISWRDNGAKVAIPADEVSVVIEGTAGSLLVVGVDGSWVEVMPNQLRDGEGAAAAVQALAPGPLVPSDDMRPGRVKAAADEQLKRRWTVSDELSLLPEMLDPDEELLSMAEAARGMRIGLVVLTDRRLLWLSAGARKEEYLKIAREDIAVAEVKRQLLGSKMLRIVVEGDEIKLDDFKPKARMAEIADALKRGAEVRDARNPLA